VCIHPWQFWEPHPLRIKRYISLVVQRRRPASPLIGGGLPTPSPRRLDGVECDVYVCDKACFCWGSQCLVPSVLQ